MKAISAIFIIALTGCASTTTDEPGFAIDSNSCTTLTEQLRVAQDANQAAESAYGKEATPANLAVVTQTSADLAGVQGDYNYAGCQNAAK